MIIELNNDSLTELKTYIKDCSAILKDTNNAIFYFNIENQELEFYTQSVTSLTKFECHADFDSLDDNEYFVVNMKKFFAAISKASNNIKFIYTDNVLTFSYPDNNKSKIEVSTSDEVTKQEMEICKQLQEQQYLYCREHECGECPFFGETIDDSFISCKILYTYQFCKEQRK